MQYILVLTFVAENGDKINLSLSNVKQDITEAQVKATMDAIIQKNIFVTKGGNLIRRSAASIKEVMVSKLNVLS